jgi:site-specific recombinase XerD
MIRLTKDTYDISILTSDYLCFLIDRNITSDIIDTHENVLHLFLRFISENAIKTLLIFAPKVLDQFYRDFRPKNGPSVINGFIRYLKRENIVCDDLIVENDDFCGIFAEYLKFFQRCGSAQHHRHQQILSTLKAFNQFLLTNQISLDHLNIEIIDRFLFETYQAKKSVDINRSALRGFLRYLYHEKGIGEKDLSSSLIIAPSANRVKPPDFLRHNDIKKLLDATSVSTDRELRTNAIVRIAFSTGMRPVEIANISLDDIRFKSRLLTIPVRKSKNPVTLPLPDDTIKAIAAYIISARPEIKERALFLSLKPPYWPISSDLVKYLIRELMKKAGVPGTPYSLRHSFAQNLLASGASIFDIKDMMGHEVLKTTGRYLSIDTQLMRKALFDE